MADPLPKYAKVDTRNPSAWAQCDRCGFWRNREDLVWQVEWSGQRLYNIQILVCADRCFDTPQEQLRTIILPPDPPPIINARVPDFAYEEQIPLIDQLPTPPDSFASTTPWGAGPALILCDQSGEIALLAQYTQST